jgi:hypothetical protein
MWKSIMRGGGLAILLAVGAALAGCFSPDFGLAECAACSGSCVGDLVCQEGFCVYPGSTTICSENAGGGAGEQAEAGSAGRPHLGGSSGAGTSGGSGGTTSTGASGDAGAGMAEGGAAGHGSLQIEVAGPEHGCTTRQFASSWSVEGGAEPYTWTLLQAPAGFLLTPSGDQATVEGTPGLPGDERVRVRVTDAAGNEGEREWIVPVLATPVLSTRELPDVCPNEIYSQTFTTDGASAGGLTWSVNPEFVEQTGLDFEGDRLTGAFIGVGPDTFALEVTVTNGSCAAEPVELTLAALGDTDPSCPHLVAAARSQVLPQPCLAQPYEGELLVQGGSGNYTLEAVALPATLSFDEVTQSLSGIVTERGIATLRVTDENGHTAEQSFTLEPRTSCWLAYLSDETGHSRLHLFDPELDRRHVVPDNDSDGPVLDFAFSPNGRAIAFRLSAGVDVARVALLPMSSLETSPLSFESATAYAWSNDSSTLAVAYDTPNGRYLGGASLAGATPETDPIIAALAPVEAEIDAELTWFADSFVAFLTDYRADVAWFGTTSNVPGGFDELHLRTDDLHARGSRLRAGTEGVFVFPPSDLQIVYYPADGSAPRVHDQIPRALRAMAPSGRYLARVAEPNLELLLADQTSILNAPAADSKPGCDAILAWARGRERIACATTEDGGRVSFFDVNTATDRLSERTHVLGTYALPKGSQTQRWRTFSATGDRFAFTSGDDDSLYVAVFDDGTPRVHSLGPVALVDDSFHPELMFSPDERLLAVHRNRYLRVFYAKPKSVAFLSASSALRSSVRCEEDFAGRTGPYCGEELPAAPYAWSGDSRWLAYQEETGTLKVMDLRRQKETEDVSISASVVVGEPCAETCPGGSAFAYQPQ